MKRPLLLLIMLSLLTGMASCKKAIEKKQEDMLMQAITDGIWYVEKYLEDASNISSNFAGYEFKFKDDGTVTGTRDGIVSNGNWVGNVSNYSITADFPIASDTLQKLNGVWIITDSYWDYVEADKTKPAGKDVLHLRKKP